ncbi:MAG: nuclear transport factor 2 family protein [Burkholderiaceae bacterium]
MTPINAAEAVSTDEDLRSLERTRLRALVDRDFELALALHSPEFHLITPRGSTYLRESYLEAVEVRRIVYLKWQAAGILVRRLGNVALLRYRAELEMPNASGEPESFECWHTDSYELHDGFWRVVWSQATRIR